MSKFLKFIVHLVIVCAMLGVLALVVPPFAGINTTVIDSVETDTNLDFGSVTYSKSVPAGAVQAGDQIVLNQEGGVYCLKVTNVNQEDETYTVKDQSGILEEEVNLDLNEQAYRVMFTVPFLGFLLVSVQSTEGLIILGLAVLFLIILYIIAELWKKDPKKNEEYESVPQEYKEPETEYQEDGTPVIKSKKELKKEEKERAKRLKEEDRKMKEEEKSRKKKEKKRKKAIRTGGFVDELTEDDLYDIKIEESDQGAEVPVVSDILISEPATEEQEISAEGVESENVDMGKTQIIPTAVKETSDIQETEETNSAPSEEESEELQDTQVVESEKKEEMAAEEEEAEETIEIKTMAVPLYTVKELYEKAQAAGDDPEIYQDEVSGVTLFDYSRVIAGEKEEEE